MASITAVRASRRWLGIVAVSAILLAAPSFRRARVAIPRAPAKRLTQRTGSEREEEARRLAVAFAEGNLPASALARRNRHSLVAALASAQRHTPDTDEEYFDITFTLAWLGYDYRANVERLVYPVDLWERDLPRYERRYPEPTLGGDTPVYYNPSMLQRLYLHRPDTAILRTLLTWGLDGAAAEGLSDERFEILKKSPLVVLDTARRSRRMTEELLLTLEYSPEEGDLRRLERTMRRLTRANRRLRRYALRLLRDAAAQRLSPTR